MKPSLLVLAAGMGSRYGGLKQLDPVGPSGEIILDYSIFDALRCGFGKVVFLIRHDIEKAFREAVGARWEKKIQVEYAFQELDALPNGFLPPPERVKPWGTGHALLCAEPRIQEPFAVINADDFYGLDGFSKLSRSLTSPQSGKITHSMVGFILRNTLSENGSVSRGVCKTKDGFLTEITERTDIVPTANGAVCKDENGRELPLTGEEIVSMNMWGFQPDVFREIKPMFTDFLKTRGTELKSEFYMPSAVFEAIRKGLCSVNVLESGDSWFGVTYREDKPFVEKSIRNLTAAGRYPGNLFE